MDLAKLTVAPVKPDDELRVRRLHLIAKTCASASDRRGLRRGVVLGLAECARVCNGVRILITGSCGTGKNLGKIGPAANEVASSGQEI